MRLPVKLPTENFNALVLAQGRVQHNESSKIYYYLRAGLPVISEKPVPNNRIIQEANLGYLVEYNQNEEIADRIEEAIRKDWDRAGAIRYILDHHTWDHRVEQYFRLIRSELQPA